jgi:hypothetical protein
MATRKVSTKEETRKLLRLYVVKPRIWVKRPIHYKDDKKKRDVLPFNRRDVKKDIHWSSAKTPKNSNTIYCVTCPCTVSYKNTNHQQMRKESFIINRNTLLHVSTLLGHLQRELFVIVTLRLHFIVERECAVDCVLLVRVCYDWW